MGSHEKKSTKTMVMIRTARSLETPASATSNPPASPNGTTARHSSKVMPRPFIRIGAAWIINSMLKNC